MAAADVQTATAQMARSIKTLVNALQDCAANAEILLKACTDGAAADLEINGKRKRVTKPKEPKDPNQPKRPASSYLIYQNEKRKELRIEFPNLTHQELTNLISEQWAKMTEAEKQPFIDRHAEQDAVYKTNIKIYKDAKEADSPPAVTPVVEKKAVKPRAPKAVAAVKEKPKIKSAPAVASSSSGESSEDESSPESTAVLVPHAKGSSDVSDSESGSDDEEPPQPPPKKQKLVVKEKDKKKKKA